MTKIVKLSYTLQSNPMLPWQCYVYITPLCSFYLFLCLLSCWCWVCGFTAKRSWNVDLSVFECYWAKAPRQQLTETMSCKHNQIHNSQDKKVKVENSQTCVDVWKRIMSYLLPGVDLPPPPLLGPVGLSNISGLEGPLLVLIIDLSSSTAWALVGLSSSGRSRVMRMTTRPTVGWCHSALEFIGMSTLVLWMKKDSMVCLSKGYLCVSSKVKLKWFFLSYI